MIRTCPLKATGSSRCGTAVPQTVGLLRGDTLVRHGVLGVVPTSRPQRGTPSLHGARNEAAADITHALLKSQSILYRGPSFSRTPTRTG
jgi:hypothetical protein